MECSCRVSRMKYGMGGRNTFGQMGAHKEYLPSSLLQSASPLTSHNSCMCCPFLGLCFSSASLVLLARSQWKSMAYLKNSAQVSESGQAGAVPWRGNRALGGISQDSMKIP